MRIGVFDTCKKASCKKCRFSLSRRNFPCQDARNLLIFLSWHGLFRNPQLDTKNLKKTQKKLKKTSSVMTCLSLDTHFQKGAPCKKRRCYDFAATDFDKRPPKVGRPILFSPPCVLWNAGNHWTFPLFEGLKSTLRVPLLAPRKKFNRDTILQVAEIVGENFVKIDFEAKIFFLDTKKFIVTIGDSLNWI